MHSPHYIKLNNKYYTYFIQEDSEFPEMVTVNFPDLEFQTIYPKEELLNFLGELPEVLENFIELKKEEKKQDTILRFRITKQEKSIIQKKARKKGYKTTSSFIREVVLAD